MSSLLYIFGIVIFFVAILVSIGLHELGHMIPAKAFGGKVTQYFIGFGPTVWSRQRGETEYGVKAIPLGGYVKIVGMLPPGAEGLVEETTYDEDGEPVHKVRRSNTGLFTQLISDARAAEWEYVKKHETDRLFYRLPWWKKVIVMAGGPMVNIAIPFSVFAVLFATYGNPRDQVVEPVVESVPAWERRRSGWAAGRRGSPPAGTGHRSGATPRAGDPRRPSGVPRRRALRRRRPPWPPSRRDRQRDVASAAPGRSGGARRRRP